MGAAVALDFPGRGAVRSADRSHRAYFDRRRGRTAAVGAAAVAVPADVGAGVPVTSIAAAWLDAGIAATRDCRRHHPAGGGRRAEPAADARWASALFLRDRHGLPRRTGAQASGLAPSYGILCRAVVWRHGRRPVRGADRAIHVLMDRGISHPDRARRAMPPAARRGVAAVEPLVLARPRSDCRCHGRAGLCGRIAAVVARRPSRMGGWDGRSASCIDRPG